MPVFLSNSVPPHPVRLPRRATSLFAPTLNKSFLTQKQKTTHDKKRKTKQPRSNQELRFFFFFFGAAHVQCPWATHTHTHKSARVAEFNHDAGRSVTTQACGNKAPIPVLVWSDEAVICRGAFANANSSRRTTNLLRLTPGPSTCSPIIYFLSCCFSFFHLTRPCRW